MADFLLKRFLKFLLKRSVGRFLQSELDLEQLDVQLGKGSLELRNVLLHCDNINKHLVRALGGLRARSTAARARARSACLLTSTPHVSMPAPCVDTPTSCSQRAA